MAESETTEQTEAEETNGNGTDTRKAAVRAAAIAAASGATALAAKKAFSGRSSGSDDEGGGSKRPARRGGDESLITTMVSSGWDSARDTLVPMIEDAATHAGEYVANNAPEIVTDTLVPQFIRGFERAQKKNSSGDDEDEE